VTFFFSLAFAFFYSAGNKLSDSCLREFFLFIIIVTLFPLNKMPPWFILVEGQQAFDDKNVEEVRQGKFSYAVFTAWIACTAEFFFIFQHVVSCPSSFPGTGGWEHAVCRIYRRQNVADTATSPHSRL
jgi:hypothetical protein